MRESKREIKGSFDDKENRHQLVKKQNTWGEVGRRDTWGIGDRKKNTNKIS